MGDTVTQNTFENKIYITDFFFTTCPGICTKMTENMSKIQEVFKEDAEVLLFISLRYTFYRFCSSPQAICHKSWCY
ncbi:MAG: SCO family protein [Flavobacteriaceae bacterium]|nr:SCO family protein [Flavobacteriaceae bacterium]